MLGFSAIWAGTALADTVSLSLSSSTPAIGTPITATVAANSTPINNDGGGPYLYEVTQPASAGSCQPTYGQDIQVVGSQATSPDGNDDQLNTGATTSTFNIAEYSQASYYVCVWVEDTSDDYSGVSGVTTSDVLAHAQAAFTTGNTNTLAVSFSTAVPRPNVPFSVTLSGNATPLNDDGAGPLIYVIAQPTSAGECQPTYGDDEQVVGSRADSLDDGDRVSTGQFSEQYQFTGKAGTYEICAWLETDDDYANSGTSSSEVLASAGPIDFTVAAAPHAIATVCVVPAFHNATLATIKKRLTAAHCRVGSVYLERDRSVRWGRVIRLSHRVGATLTSETRIGIYVSGR